MIKLNYPFRGCKSYCFFKLNISSFMDNKLSKIDMLPHILLRK